MLSHPASPNRTWPDPEDTDFTTILPKEPARRIPAVEDRGITSLQLHELLDFAHEMLIPASRSTFNRALWFNPCPESNTYRQPIQYRSMNLYHANTWIIRPATKKHSSPPVSYVELISPFPEKQLPRWFVSHAWIEPIIDFVTCIDAHCTERGLGQDSPFWVCAYCVNQHEAVEAFPTSFFKAMKKCQCMLLILDDNGPATPFTRIWCCFEIFIALDEHKGPGNDTKFDICAVKRGKAFILIDGLTDAEKNLEFEKRMNLENTSKRMQGGWVAKRKRESAFPLDVLWKGLSVDVENACASEEIDKARILNCIATKPPHMLDQAPSEKHYSYVIMSRRLAGILASVAWRTAVEQTHTSTISHMHPLQAALGADRHREHLALCFESCTNFSQQQLELLADGLPSNLKTLQLDFGYCEQLVDVTKLGHAIALMSCLTYLHLEFRGCHQILNTDELAHSIGNVLTLRTLCVSFRECYQLETFDTLHKSLARLRELSDLTLLYYGCDRCTCVHELRVSLTQLIALTSLTLNFQRCYELQDGGMLASVIPGLTSLRTLKVNLHSCHKSCADELVRSISMHKGLQSIEFVHPNGQSWKELVEFLPFKFKQEAPSQTASHRSVSDICQFIRFVGGDWCLKISAPWLDYLSLIQSRDLKRELDQVARDCRLTDASLISHSAGSRIEFRAEKRNYLNNALECLTQADGALTFYESQFRRMSQA